jgi:hypothetical protein
VSTQAITLHSPPSRRGRPPKYPAEERWCEYCGKSLGAIPGGQLRHGKGRFCDHSCHMSWRWANQRQDRMEDMGKAAETRRKYEQAERSCRHCGKSLGLLNGSRIVSGRGHFCSRRCVMLHGWSQGGLRRERTGQLVKCPGCGAERYRRPSRLGTDYCRKCRGELPDVQAPLLDQHEQRRAGIAERRKSGLWVIGDIAQRWGRSTGHVWRVASEGFLKTEPFVVAGVMYHGLEQKHGSSFLRECTMSGPKRREQWRQRMLADRREGRPPREAPSEQHAQWKARYDEILSWQTRAFAAGDLDEIPKVWARSHETARECLPAEYERNSRRATMRVYKALYRL